MQILGTIIYLLLFLVPMAQGASDCETVFSTDYGDFGESYFND